MMTDDQLRHYVESYGKRIAIFNHCRRQQQQSKTTSKKNSVLDLLRAKLRAKDHNNENMEDATASTSASMQATKVSGRPKAEFRRFYV